MEVSRQFCLTGLPKWQTDIIERYPLVYREVDAEAVKWYHMDRRRGLDHEKRLKDGGEGNDDAALMDDATAPGADYCNLRYGFEFGQGWAKLAEDLGSTASALVEHLRAVVRPDAYIHAFIFKEKFGELRWQGRHNLIEPFKSLFDGFTESLEDRSKYICEVTGKIGELRYFDGWLTTLCDEEFRKECKRRGLNPKKVIGKTNKMRGVHVMRLKIYGWR
jgi:hypothetical protein